jgi:hypothetical protein
MHRTIQRGLLPLAASALILATGWPVPVRAGSSAAVLYESFGAAGISSLNANTAAGLNNLFQTATNIVAGDGRVYFENGDTISWTSANLVGVHTLIVNNTPATGLALDASTGILYETFGSNGITALNATTGAGLANLFQTATNIVAGNGTVYFENGATISTTSSLLVGVNTFHVNGAAPTGLALDPAAGLLFESFGANGISSLNTATGAGVANLFQTATNIIAGDGRVYFENGSAIDTTSTQLTGVNTFHANGIPPAGLALVVTTASVPEPSTLGLIVSGLLCLAARRLRPFSRRRS